MTALAITRNPGVAQLNLCPRKVVDVTRDQGQAMMQGGRGNDQAGLRKRVIGLAPFLDHLGTLGWTAFDQGHGFIPSDPTASLRVSFLEWL